MKKGFIFSICFIALCNAAHTQDTTTLYAGILSRSEYRNGNTAVSANLHVGGLATLQINRKFSYTGFAAVQLAKNGGFAVNVHFLEYTPNTKWNITVGSMATPTTEQRSHPVSSGGQFETWTQALIPGAAPGIKAKRLFSKSHAIGAGIAIRNRVPEYHASYMYKKITVAGFYSSKLHGGAVTYNAKRLYAIGVYKNATIGNTTVLTLIPKLNIKSFWDAGYNHQTHTLERLELGVMKTFSAKHCNGIFSIAYDEKVKSITGYVFIYIIKKGGF